MNINLKAWAIAFVVGILLDMIWIGFIAKKFYLEQLGPIGRITGTGSDAKFDVVIWAAVGVYILISLSIVMFVLPQSGTMMSTFLTGALLGLLVYGVYDLTNYATLKDYTLPMVFVDMAWGTFLYGATSAISQWILAKV